MIGRKIIELPRHCRLDWNNISLLARKRPNIVLLHNLHNRFKVIALSALKLYQSIFFIDPEPCGRPIIMSARGARTMPLASLFLQIIARYNTLCPFRPYCFWIVVHFKMVSRRLATQNLLVAHQILLSLFFQVQF